MLRSRHDPRPKHHSRATMHAPMESERKIVMIFAVKESVMPTRIASAGGQVHGRIDETVGREKMAMDSKESAMIAASSSAVCKMTATATCTPVKNAATKKKLCRHHYFSARFREFCDLWLLLLRSGLMYQHATH